MKSNTLLGIILIGAGAAIVYFGYNASGSPLEQISKEITGHFSDETMAYFIGGGILALGGLYMVMKR